MIKAAYDNYANQQPYLPPRSSSLPALLALRETHNIAVQTVEAIDESASQLSAERALLERERADLRDAQLLSEALDNRTTALRRDTRHTSQKSPNQAAKDAIRVQRQRKSLYDRDAEKLRIALKSFENDHLAALLAAEELGGPVVGDMMEVDDDVLEAGFNSKGKVKKQAKPTKAKITNQQTLHQAWTAGEDPGETSERERCGEELHSLIEALLKATADDNNSSSYITLDKDTASARFLVRAKVAQYHPRDARRLRLIDFAREMDS